jgi:hypothetical protein
VFSRLVDTVKRMDAHCHCDSEISGELDYMQEMYSKKRDDRITMNDNAE